MIEAPEAGLATDREAELKYRLKRGDDGLRYVESDELAGLSATGPAVVVQHEDRYVDTAGGAIKRGGHAARIRRSGESDIVTVKSGEEVRDGLADREELEGPAGDTGSPEGWPQSKARDLLLELVRGEPLVEQVTLRQERHKREFAADSTRVEVSVDNVEVMVGEVVAGTFGEVEIELVDGDGAALPAIQAALAGDAALRPAKRSKVESALAIVRRAEERTAKVGARAAKARARRGTTDRTAPSEAVVRVTGNPGVEATDPLAEAGRKVLRFHFARMLAREAAVRDPENHDIEDLHAMRVAVRRMRAAWRFFGDAYRPGKTKQLRGRLRTVGDRLGAVRDLDVLLDGATSYLEHHRPADAVGLVPLLEAWHTERSESERILLVELDSPGYARWHDEYREFVTTDGAAAMPGTPTAPGRVRDTGASRLWTLFEQVRGYEQVMPWADVPTLHQLRIDAKRLRYAFEFLREALPSEAQLLIKPVVALQDHVGALHDADVAAARARALLVEGSSRLTPPERAAVARYLESRERELSRLRRTAHRPYGTIVAPTFRRRLARIVAAL
ncbi:MAG TPA: CHAD domain-containing protein [Candidatus Eisenbacteria bacterium]|nr:CHAD domain-containing protein [Candidatus Eisenbacteria bacterium]